MSVPVNVLLVDMGNTSIKYAVCDGPLSPLHVKTVHKVDALISALDGVTQLLLASVGSSDRVKQLRAASEKTGIQFRQVTTEAKQLGILCAYQQVSNLGVDRWLAVLAARQITHKPVAVIDAGTAITCDFVIGQRHVGGWIAPGLRVMRDALTANTTFVFADESRCVNAAVGEDTPACVNQGCLAAAQGVLLSAERELRKYSDDYAIVVSGGDRDCFTEMAQSHIIFVENIVLAGLQRCI